MFRQLTPRLFASFQITLAEVDAAAAQGIGLIVNNRPEGESDDQTPGDEIAAACAAHGIAYVAIPVTHAGFSQPQVEAMAAALAGTDKPVLAYCRSGTRSTHLWALTRARAGDDVDAICAAAARAGYDLAALRPMMDALAGDA